MKSKATLVVGAIIIFLAGILVGRILSQTILGEKKTKEVVLSESQTLESRVNQLAEEVREVALMVIPQLKNQPEPGRKYEFNLENSPVLGNPDAPVKIVVWSEFQCPYSKRMNQKLEELVESEPDKYALYYKTRIIHARAILEHEAGYSAHRQGKFWQLSKLFYEHQAEMVRLSREDQEKYKERIIELAEQAGVDVDLLRQDLDSHKYLAQLQAENKEANEIGVRGTPAVFINGYYYGADPEVVLEEVKKQAEFGEPDPVEAGLERIKSNLDYLKKYFKARQRKEFDLTNSPRLGKKDAKVKLVVFSDFQCPFCQKMAKLLEEKYQEHSEEVAVYFKNFVVHSKAMLEHQAAMSAWKQGKFWEYHDLLFQNRQEMIKISKESQEKLKEKLIEFAQQLGLDQDKFLTDLESEEVKQIIEQHLKEGREAGVRGTPTVYINGYFYGYNPDTVMQKIDQEIKK